MISVSITEPLYGKTGWEFGTAPGAPPDNVNGKTTLAEIYLLADPHYTGRVSVPVLWDKKRRTIVNNESSEIIRMLNSAFDAFTDAHTDYYPAALRAEIDRINDLVYPNINNGVYRAGFATSQDAYEEAARGDFRGARSDRGAAVTPALSGRPANHRSGLAAVHHARSASTPSITATSNAICGASPTIPICRITCAISIRCRASPRPSASIRSSGTITAASGK